MVVTCFASHGFRVIDADRIAREVVMPGEPALRQLAAAFGEDILLPDGTLDRRTLADRAFASRENTDRMNAIMLTEIVSRMTERADAYRAAGENCLFDAPLLLEAHLEEVCDCCVAVIAPLDVRIRRLIARDGLTEDEIRRRVSRQHEDAYYTSRCQYIIYNDSDLSALESQTEQLIRTLTVSG